MQLPGKPFKQRNMICCGGARLSSLVSAEGAVAIGSFHCQSCSLGSFRPINVNFTEETTCRTSVSDSRIDAYFFPLFFLISSLNSVFILSLFRMRCSKVCEHFRKRTTRTTSILVKTPSVMFVFAILSAWITLYELPPLEHRACGLKYWWSCLAASSLPGPWGCLDLSINYFFV